MNLRTGLAFLHDVTVAAFAWFGAYALRFNFEIPPSYWQAISGTLLLVVPVQAIVFHLFGLYRGIWRFASVPDLKRILMACGVAALATPAVLVMTQHIDAVPRSVLALDPLLLVLLMGGARFTYRAWKDGHLSFGGSLVGEPALIMGAGDSAVSLLRELARNGGWRVVGILDDSEEKQGRLLNGVRVLGPLESVADQVQKSGASHVIIAMPASSAAQRRRAAELAAAAGVVVLTVPAFEDLLSGRVAISQIRKVELEDLLGREQVKLDEDGLHRLLAGKVVMVTGAGGSIGAELCRQIARFSPRLLVFYEISEYALYTMEQEFAKDGNHFVCAVGDVRDETRLAEVFEQHRPEVVFHAAAYKHVPMMEGENAWEAVRNNVLGTMRVARAAEASGVREFVLISTDKAVNPTNVMGATKRLAELACQVLQTKMRMCVVIVRFGNVLGSSGSVIPKFRDQIARGGPVTVTHPDIIRYFMLIPEAARLVLQAGHMANSDGEGGRIFVLDMGEPVRISDLAKDMIRLSGFTDDEIRIKFTGLRPGEKLYEELLADGETTMPTPHPKLRIMKPIGVPDASWLSELESWLECPVRSESETKQGLRRLVPEYQPASRTDQPCQKPDLR